MILTNKKIYTLSNLLVSGLEKISSVIESNPTYYQILGSRLNKDEYKHLGKPSDLIESKIAEKFLLGKVEGIKSKRFYIPEILSETVLMYGSTANNLKEFDFFVARAEDYGFFSKYENMAHWKSKNETLTAYDNGIEKAFRNSLIKFLNSRSQISLSQIHQFINFYISFNKYYEVFNNNKVSKVLLANDHSPIPVAVHKVASFFNAQVCYLQHAEINNNFPALDFDYAVLRNQYSKKIYASKGSVGTFIQVCDRGTSTRRNKNVFEDVYLTEFLSSKIQDLVIYPSSVFNQEKLLSFYRELESLKSVNSIIVKLHPSYKKIQFFRENDIAFTHSHLDYKHIAICGNSSVVIELINNGNLVVQNFSLDSIPADYYSFVEKGLSLDITRKPVKECFWQDLPIPLLSSKNWAELMPSVPSRINELEKSRESLFFSLFFYDTSRKIVSKERSLERDIFHFWDAFIENERNRDKYYDKNWLRKKLESIFNNRDPRLNSLYGKANLDKCGSVAEFWLNTKKCEWTGYIPSENQIIILIKFITQTIETEENTNSKRYLIEWMETKIFDLLIRNNHSKILVDFLSSCRYFSVEKTSISKKIAFVNYTNSNPCIQSTLLNFFDYKSSSLSELERLKIDVQCSLREMDGDYIYRDYKEVEDKFISFHPCIKAEYCRYVTPVYQKISGRDRFINVKFSEEEKTEFINLVKSFLLKKCGFSFIRLSDGEGFIFKDITNHFTEDDSQNRQRHWWGEIVPQAESKVLLNDLLDAVKSADVLGIPSVYRFLRDHTDSTKSLSNTIQGRGLLSVLQGIDIIENNKTLYGDDKLNIACLNGIETIVELAKMATGVVIVNSGTFDSMANTFGKYFKYNHIQVPTHNKTSTNEKYSAKSKPLPLVYKDIEDKLLQTCKPGNLVLVGAGVAGKSFLNIAKQCGAVGLDLGSAMDQFIGGNIHSLY